MTDNSPLANGIEHLAPLSRDGDPLGLAPALVPLVDQDLICTEVLTVFSVLDSILRGFVDHTLDNSEFRRTHFLVYSAIHALATSSKVSDLDVQLCCGAIGLYFLVLTLCTDAHDVDASQAIDALQNSLDAVANIFIHKRHVGAHDSPSHQAVFRVAAFLLGCACLYPSPRTSSSTRVKGQIILFSMHENLFGLSGTDEAYNNRRPFSELIFDALVEQSVQAMTFPDVIVPMLRRIYIAAAMRQQEWESRGLFRMGMSGDDRVEYMVLRHFRGEYLTAPSPLAVFWSGSCLLTRQTDAQVPAPNTSSL
jgi:hypothetical protein